MTSDMPEGARGDARMSKEHERLLRRCDHAMLGGDPVSTKDRHELLALASAGATISRLEGELAEAVKVIEPLLPRDPRGRIDTWFKALASLPGNREFVAAPGYLWEWRVRMGDLRAAASWLIRRMTAPTGVKNLEGRDP